MNAITPRHSFPRTLAYLIVLSVWTASGYTGFAAATTGTTVKAGVVSTSEAVVPKSIFAYRAGKDPFFPNRPKDDDKAPPPPENLEAPVLRGITGNADRRVALINDRTFTKGEAGEIKVGTNTHRIRVIEIKDRSVIIERGGQAGRTELPLRDNVLPISKEE